MILFSVLLTKIFMFEKIDFKYTFANITVIQLNLFKVIF